MSFPIPTNENKRLEALHRYNLLDTAPEQSFDDFTRLAAYICSTPIALVTLLDAERQWFKAKIGLELSETPREQAFCSHTILSDQLMVVNDAVADDRFSENPLVTGDPHIRFYAGAPLVDGEGFGLGSLCVIDRKPRQLTDEQLRALEALGRQLVAQCEFRRISAVLADALSEVKTLQGLLPLCAHCKSVKNDEGYWHRVDQYLEAHSEASLTRTICPDCLKIHFPKIHARFAAEGKV